MSEDAARDEIASRLRQIGYEVENVPEGGTETADLCAWCKTDTLLVEVKSRTDDEALKEKLEKAEEHEAVWDSQSINWNSPSDRLLHKVRSQLTKTPDEYQGIGGMWLIPEPHLVVSAAAQQLKGTLLGIRDVFLNDAEGNGLCSSCVFATHAAFRKFPEVAFAVLEIDGGHQMLVNPFSPRADEVRETRLHEFFGEGVLDVDRIVSGPDLLVVRGDFSRKDEEKTLSVLREQHPDFEIQGFLDLQMHRGNIRVSERAIQQRRLEGIAKAIDAEAEVSHDFDANRYTARGVHGEAHFAFADVQDASDQKLDQGIRKQWGL